MSPNRLRTLLSELRWCFANFWDAVRTFLSWLARAMARRVFTAATISVIAAAVSAAATWFTYQTSVQSTEISRASQAFSERLYREQLALGRPSVSAVAGHTFLVWHEPPDEYSLDRAGKDHFAIEIRLHNSGGRDAHIVRIAVGGEEFPQALYEQTLDVLPKDTEIPVRFDEIDPYEVQSRSWWVAFAYSDELPAQGGKAVERDSTTDGLVRTCSSTTVVEMIAVRAPLDSASTRVLAAGAPSYVLPALARKPSLGGLDRSVAEKVYDSVTNWMQQSAGCSRA